MNRACFASCLLLGRLLRAGRYSDVRVACDDGHAHVRKRRRFHAPLLVALGDPLVRVLDTGVRVLPQREWEQHERRMYRELYGMSVHVESDGTLILPYLRGSTLAAILEEPELDAAHRRRAIELAVTALVALHRSGFTHGDAMAENVMVDADADVACWFDFETVHQPQRTVIWRRADDLRALLATCLLRSAPGTFDGTLDLVLDRYDDDVVASLLSASFSTACSRPLSFHLGQAALSAEQYRRIAALLARRSGTQQQALSS